VRASHSLFCSAHDAPDPDDEHLRAMELHARRRQRRYWLWMSLLPGLLGGPMIWLLYLMEVRWNLGQDLWPLLPLLAVGWVFYCVARLEDLLPEGTTWPRAALALPMFLGLLALNGAILWGLLLAGCAIAGTGGFFP